MRILENKFFKDLVHIDDVIENLRLIHTRFVSLRFIRSTLSSCEYGYVSIENAVFYQSQITGIYIAGLKFKNCTFISSHILLERPTDQKIEFESCIFENTTIDPNDICHRSVVMETAPSDSGVVEKECQKMAKPVKSSQPTKPIVGGRFGLLEV